MRRKWVLAGLLFVMLCLQLQPQARAFRADADLRWECGFKLNMLVENNDFWTTNAVSDIYVVLTLLDPGTIASFDNLIVTICVITERVDLGMISLVAPWNEPGDKIHVVGHFNITPDIVNNAAWDIYMGHFYVQLNWTVHMQGGGIMDLYTHKYVYVLNISTIPFIVLWPFPPIILMMSIYWIGYFALRRFNNRYSAFAKPRSY